jgi:hypothetical protein
LLAYDVDMHRQAQRCAAIAARKPLKHERHLSQCRAVAIALDRHSQARQTCLTQVTHILKWERAVKVVLIGPPGETTRQFITDGQRLLKGTLRWMAHASITPKTAQPALR